MNALKIILSFVLVIGASNYSTEAGSVQHRTIDFYGHSISISHDANMDKLSFSSLSQQRINSLLSQHRSLNLNRVTEDIKKSAYHFGLDDAGVVLLTDKVTTQNNRGRNNRQVFAKYVVLKELGYDIILTRTGKNLNVLGNLAFTPGRYVYLEYNRKRYIDLDFTKRRTIGQHIILRDSKKTSKKIRRNIYNVPRINARKKSKNIAFSHNMEIHLIEAKSNQSVVDFLGDLPMFDVGKQFTRIGVSKDLETTVVDYLKEEVIGMDMPEASRFLLAFVQQSTAYGSDYEKYGEERFYYPEETVMAATADCEDKAMLLAYLAKEILNINTLSLYFENDEHLSIALEIPGYAPAGSFTYFGKSYVPCEPTAKYPHLGYSQFKLRRVTKITQL